MLMILIEKIIQMIVDWLTTIIEYFMQFIQYEKISLTASFAKALITLKRSSEIHFRTLVLEFVISNILAVFVGVLLIQGGFSKEVSYISTAFIGFVGSKANDYLEELVSTYLNNLKKNKDDSN